MKNGFKLKVESCRFASRGRTTFNLQPSTLNRSNAFTLIEIVISSALMSLILISAYLCLNAGMAGKKMVEPRADIFQSARVALAFLSADLRGACRLPGDSAFLGMKRMVGEVEADNLDFATHNYTPRRAREGDFCEMSYYAEQNPQTGRFSLWRRRNPTLAPDPLAGGSKEEIARDVMGARFEYSDGLDWYENWGELKSSAKAANSQKEQSNLSGLPKAVRITLLFDSNPKSKANPQTGERELEPPLVFQTVARLELADVPVPDTGNSGSGGENSADQSAPNPQNGGQN